MQFTTAVALFATAAMAAQPAWVPPTMKRNVETFKGVFAKVGQAAGEVDSVVRAYAGGPGDDIECAVATLVEVAQGATRSLGNMTMLTAADVAGGAGSGSGSGSFHEASGGVAGAGDGLLADIEAKVPLFAEAKICNTVMTWMMDMGEHLGELMKTAAAKFPADQQQGDGSAAADIEHCRDTFERLTAKLRTCAANGGAGAPQLEVPNTAVPSTPNTLGNGTYSVHPPTAGAASFGASGALAIAALAAMAL